MYLCKTAGKVAKSERIAKCIGEMNNESKKPPGILLNTQSDTSEREDRKAFLEIDMAPVSKESRRVNKELSTTNQTAGK